MSDLNIPVHRELRGGNGPYGRIAWSPDGGFLSALSQSGLEIWNIETGKLWHKLAASRTDDLCWSPDGKYLAARGRSGVVVYEGPEFERSRSIASSDYVHSVCWLPTADARLAVGFESGIIIFYDNVGREVQQFGRHQRDVSCIRFLSASKMVSASFDGDIRLWDVNASKVDYVWNSAHGGAGIHRLAITCDGYTVVSGGSDHSIRIWRIADTKPQHILEGHTNAVTDVSLSADGQLLASTSLDNTARVWVVNDWRERHQIPASCKERSIWHSTAFHPNDRLLATLDENDQLIRIWDLRSVVFAGETVGCVYPTGENQAATYQMDGPEKKIVQYTSAKIVLVGESNVGKSCLAMRLAEDRYPDAHEHGTTHGMRFWPMEAEELHPAAKPPDGQRRDVVLWDFGGQDEYQLVHQMFLHDTTLALVLIDPTRGRAAMDEARDWNKRLEKHLGNRKSVKLLVGAQVDDDKKSGLINRGVIQALCEDCGFAGFYETSALNGREIDGFRDALVGALDWENLAKTSRPELFQRIRDEIELMREAGDVVVLVADLETSVRENRSLTEPPKKPASRRLWEFWKRKVSEEDSTRALQALPFDDSAFRAVTDQLATQGVIVKTKLTGGDDAIVLQLPVIERYAASLIVAARDNPRGVPALETSELGSPSISLPGMAIEDRVPRGQERIVLEAVAELMIEHGLCFRHEGLLVFPTLLKATETARADELPGSVSLYYDFSGAIDNVYASLISWLVIGQGFGRIRLWENRVEFEGEGQGACGLRKVNRGGGFAHLDVYFHDGTPTRTQTEFISFVHQHLRSSGIDVVEHFELICGNTDCRYEFEREVVQNRMAKGETDVVCPQCEIRIKLSEGFRHQRERDEQAERKSFALMTRVREDVPMIVASVKQRAFGRADDEYRTDRPIRILHLSDLHFTSETVAETKLQWLEDDIRKGGWLRGNEDVRRPSEAVATRESTASEGHRTGELDYVVISGDMTHQGSAPGFRRASEFVSLLVERFGLSAERFVFVPGNHDVQDLDEALDWRLNVTENEKKRAVQEGRLFGLPNDEYNNRLKEFSDQFYHPLLQKPYPLDPSRQGVAYIFPETKLQFLTLNSCWEIDQFHRTRASVHPDAVARLIAEADRQIQRAILNTDVRPEDYLRIGVWHHPVADVERGIRNREFLGNLQNNRVQICLTGDVHEMRRDLVDYWHDNRMHVLGAGSFGAKGPDLSEGSPRLYNLLEIDRDFSKIRVHTRQQPKPDGAWKGWNEWPLLDGGEGGLPYFDIPLK